MATKYKPKRTGGLAKPDPADVTRPSPARKEAAEYAEARDLLRDLDRRRQSDAFRGTRHGKATEFHRLAVERTAEAERYERSRLRRPNVPRSGGRSLGGRR